MSPHRITVLPNADFSRLREIVDSGTLEGDADLARIVRYVASSLLVVAEGQKETPQAIQQILNGSDL